jgi:hypothetical protein
VTSRSHNAKKAAHHATQYLARPMASAA